MKYFYLLLFLVTLIGSTQNCEGQIGAGCANPIIINTPDTVPPYCSDVYDGMVRQTPVILDNSFPSDTTFRRRGVMYKMTVPTGKGIHAMMVDLPVSIMCSTFHYHQVSLGVFRGSSCNNLSLFRSRTLSSCYDGGNGWNLYNQPAVIDSINEGETYYLGVSAPDTPYLNINLGIKWLPYLIDTFSCAKPDTITSLPFKGCTLSNFKDVGQFIPIPPNGNNEAFYTIIPTADSCSITVRTTSSFIDPQWGSFPMEVRAFQDCNGAPLPGTITYTSQGWNESTVTMRNLTVGQPIILAIGARYYCGDLITCPTVGIFTIEGSNILLPIHFSAFNLNYRKAEQLIDLEWLITSDRQLSKFVVERSINGSVFEQIAEVKSKGQTGLANYKYTDKQPGIGKLLYRLKAVNTDGTFKYGTIKMVLTEATDIINVFPNPIRNTINIQLAGNTDGKTDIIIMNTEGKVVYSKNHNLHNGSNSVSINTSSLSQGVYFLKIKSGKNNTIKRLVKE